MNEEALKYSYDIFKKDGYNGSIEDYNTLMSSNEEALEYSYNLFKDDGYNGEIDDFNSLLGISTQKKNPIKEEEPLESSVEEVSMDAMEEIGAGEEPSKEKSFEELAAQRSSTGVTGYPRYSPQDLGITFTDAFYNAATNQIPAQLKTTWSLNPKTLTVEDNTNFGDGTPQAGDSDSKTAYINNGTNSYFLNNEFTVSNIELGSGIGNDPIAFAGHMNLVVENIDSETNLENSVSFSRVGITPKKD